MAFLDRFRATNVGAPALFALMVTYAPLRALAQPPTEIGVLSVGYAGTSWGPRTARSTHAGADDVRYSETVASPGGVHASLERGGDLFRYGGGLRWTYLASDEARVNRTSFVLAAGAASVNRTRHWGREDVRLSLRIGVGLGTAILSDDPIGSRDRVGLAYSTEASLGFSVLGPLVGFECRVGHRYLGTFDRDGHQNRYVTNTHVAEGSVALLVRLRTRGAP